MAFWILALSYWIHLLGTVVWLGGLALMGLVAWPALQKGTLQENEWLALQRRFIPWVNGSLVVLLITGFVQMAGDENYTGFLRTDSTWAWAILLKHVAVLFMIAITAYMQFRFYPAVDRATTLAQHRPELAGEEQRELRHQEIRLLRLNMACAIAVLFFTAIATAV